MAIAPSLSGWTLVSLRPQNQHAGLRQAAARRDARLLAASPFRLQAQPAGTDLALALACPLRIAVSPAAVRFAAQTSDLTGPWLAVGRSTKKALIKAGATTVQVAQPQNAKGLLQLPELQNIGGRRIGLIGAPDGLGLLETALPARGAHLLCAHVYYRQAVLLSEQRRQHLLKLGGKVACLITSQAAFGQFWRQFSTPQQRTLQAWYFVASSPRLLHYLQGLGLTRAVLAENTQATALLNALGQIKCKPPRSSK